MDILWQEDFPGYWDVQEPLPAHTHPKGLCRVGEKQTQPGGPMRDLTETHKRDPINTNKLLQMVIN